MDSSLQEIGAYVSQSQSTKNQSGGYGYDQTGAIGHRMENVCQSTSQAQSIEGGFNFFTNSSLIPATNNSGPSRLIQFE